jgi:hypothetical protein
MKKNILERWTYLGRALAALSDASPQLVLARASKTQGHYIVNSRVRVLVKYATTPPDGPWNFDFSESDNEVLTNNITVDPSFLILVCADHTIVAVGLAEIMTLLDPGIADGRQHLRAEKARGGVRVMQAARKPSILLRPGDFPACLLE